ncbi:probable dolichyl pyrophosphate Man9GlcNAc2 alpha-1,3-glucosyltransferase [Anopheles stephensi]|uniref:probable dolichyl pyrophosphate Man9GlcNAc2 alpha-1,3-glucosyltransferase n=1 Tax=Anopheles stephensi TaxID=30069 RepID=UPI001658AAF7|nr:probable dolichyl pyrophosphate Man9GlcNAc2 alpha-1,3-glucosyltransferase [Anopheles stephensi]XP_035917819.1 probable dolichyl pyrophosphate Man9GlcNAc2 alpha-1,3-glucosyltransferase [Anopheles stephensi]
MGETFFSLPIIFTRFGPTPRVRTSVKSCQTKTTSERSLSRVYVCVCPPRWKCFVVRISDTGPPGNMDAKTGMQWLVIVAAGLFLRATVSLHSYSGQNRPPMYGDFEAQRHWQEVTVNLPVADWYRNTSDNDLLYWGLDYPPLTAYHSYLVGWWARQWHDESFVALHTSRGISTAEHKQFMRNTVLLVDAVLYLPAILYATYTILRRMARPNTEVRWLAPTLAILFPGQILIDNGHFQYNNASLALCALAVAAIVERRTLAEAVLFCLALNYKQMELYHALPFFFYLLRDCFTDGADNSSTFGQRFLVGVRNLTLLGATVLLSFIIIWLPWLGSLDAVGQLVHRIFPVARGVFEDKVSNVWCVVNVFVKLRNVPNTTMAIVCLVCTLLAVLPSGLHLLLQKNHTARSFLYSLVVTALGFFLFSFQVHEKSILLAALPATLLLPLEPLVSCWFLQLATFSMLPLLHKDGLTGAFVGLTLISLTMVRTVRDSKPSNKNHKLSYDVLHLRGLLPEGFASIGSVFVALFYLSLLGQVLLLVAFLCLAPPAHLPFLYPLLISAYSCGHFVLFYLYFNYRQFCSDQTSVTPEQPSRINNKKKVN